MSRLGRRPIPIPNGVTVSVTGGRLEATGPKGVCTVIIPSSIVAAIADDAVVVRPVREELLSKDARALWGTIWSLTRSALQGAAQGFVRHLELHGVGYRAELSGRTLRLFLGFTHPVEVEAPSDISFQVEKNMVTVFGSSKYLVGEVAASIRRLRPPEPYKGKGIRYVGEVVRRKAGKTAGTAGGAET